MAGFTWPYEEKRFSIAHEQQGAKDTSKPIQMPPVNPRAMNSSAKIQEGANDSDFPVTSVAVPGS